MSYFIHLHVDSRVSITEGLSLRTKQKQVNLSIYVYDQQNELNVPKKLLKTRDQRSEIPPTGPPRSPLSPCPKMYPGTVLTS